MSKHLQALYRSRELLFMLAWRDIRVRYKQSIMGLLWALLMPALIVGAGVLVRAAASHYSGVAMTRADLASIMVRAAIWSFFVSAVRFGTSSLIGNPNLVTKLAFPKEVFPLAATLSSLFDFLIGLLVAYLALAALGFGISFAALWSLPLLLLLVLFTAGLTMLLSAANLYFRDVKYLVEALLTYAIFFTPVLYDASATGQWRDLILLNPVAPLIEGISDAIVFERHPIGPWILYSAAASLLTATLGYSYFKRLERNFAERI